MNILIIGTGYVGLVTAACFADMGHHVRCLDIDAQKIEALQKGHIPFFEPRLDELVSRGRKAGRLSFSNSYQESVPGADLCFLALPTPMCTDGSCDTTALFTSVEILAKVLTHPIVLVVKSTAPMGTAHALKEHLRSRGAEVSIAVNPEFLKQGDAVADFMKPDRIVLGVEDIETERLLRDLYRGFSMNHDRVLVMDICSAELAKYAANAMLATRISFMNELALLCEKMGASIQHVRLALGADRRIGHAFLYPGVGYGGSCFPKDLQALLSTAKEKRAELSIVRAVHEVNEKQKRLLGQKIIQTLGPLRGKKIAIWGLAFKPETDDMRGAPSLTLIDQLLNAGATLHLFDPVAMPNAKRALKNNPRLLFRSDEYDAARDVDAIALLTEWKQFRFVDVPRIASLVRSKVFFDGRHQFDPEKMRQHGFAYYAIGHRVVC